MTQIGGYFSSIQMFNLESQELSDTQKLLDCILTQQNKVPKISLLTQLFHECLTLNGLKVITLQLRPGNGPEYKAVKIDETRYELEIEAIHAVFSKIIIHRNEKTAPHGFGIQKSHLTHLAKEFSSFLTSEYLQFRVGIPEPALRDPTLELAHQGVYSAYLDQLQKALKDTALLDLDFTAQTPRASYNQYLEAFAKVCETNKEEESVKIKKQAHWHYTSVNLDADLWNLLIAYVPALASAPPLDLLTSVATTWKALALHPHLDGKVDKDYLRHEISWFLWSDGGTRFYRIPIPIVVQRKQDPKGNKIQYRIQAIFKRYLEAIAEKKKHHHYVSSLNPRSTLMILPSEMVSSKVIHELQTKHPNYFKASTYNRNGPFYDGETFNITETKLKETAEYFKQAIFPNYKKLIAAYLFDKEVDYPFQWPLNTPIDEWKRTTTRMIDRVHEHYFQACDMSDFTLHDVFNELSLVALLDHQISTDRPEHCNISCLATSDRGPSFYALLYLFRLRKRGIEIGPLEIRKILTMLFCPAIMTSKRPIHHGRIMLFLKAAGYIMRLPPFTYTPH